MLTKHTQNIVLGSTIWLIASLFFLYEFFLRTFIGSIAHQIITDLHLGSEQFALMSSSYCLAYGMMQIPVGILIDRFGVKKMMIIATLICSLATFLFSHATHFSLAMLSRFFMGFGSSFAFICLLVIAWTWFPRRYFGFFAGSSQFIGTIGPVLAGGPLIALTVAFHGWRLTLTAIAAVGIILVILIFFVVKDKQPSEKPALLYLSWGHTLKTQLPFLIRNKQTWVIAIYCTTVYVSLALMGAVWGTEYLEARGLLQSSAAYMISIAWIFYAIGCPFFGILSDFSKRRKPYLVLCGLLGLIATSLIVYGPVTKVWMYGVLFSLLGLGASGQNIGFAAIIEHAKSGTRATALGLNNASITLLNATLPLAVGWFVGHASHGHWMHLVPSDFTIGLSVMPMVYLLACFISLFLFEETYCKLLI